MKKTTILLFLILLKFVLHYFLIAADYELHRDEFLHLDQANHLDWGFTSVPPFTSWVSLLIKILGNGIFWIKFFPALFGALTILLVWKTIDTLKGGTFACLFGSCCLIFSSLLGINVLYQPNSFDVLCWTAFYYCSINYINRNRSKYLYFMAFVFALGFLNKYSIVFLLLGFIPALLLSKERKVFGNKHLYYAAALAFILILPNLIWQYQQHFPVFTHMQQLAATQLVHVNRGNFIAAQFLFFPGTFPVVLIAFWALLYDSRFQKYRVFLYSFSITLGIFLFFKAKSYYAFGLYPIYIAFGAVYLGRWIKKPAPVLKTALVSWVIISFIPQYRLAFPKHSPAYIVQHPEKYRKHDLLTWEDGKQYPLPQDFADMLGWKELARKVDSIYLGMPYPKNTLILCDSYGQAGAINYYSTLGLQAVSFEADYINWFNLRPTYRNLIRVKYAWEREAEMAGTGPIFEHAALADSITTAYARENGTLIFSFTGAKINITDRIKQEIETKKNTP
ncbi:glycosyltransferase family 39 protein [Sphingobacterium sp. Mn56C]|uniref:glycosyltransferase family 39 protein n=1 Tax=Sphingobacterium sp. Mn56C TaxID=3395261 RepID=UPI003BCE6A26